MAQFLVLDKLYVGGCIGSQKHLEENKLYKLVQVIVWTDQKTLQMNETYKFKADVQIRNVTKLIPKMVNSDIMAKLGNIGAVTDLMKYEVKQKKVRVNS